VVIAVVLICWKQARNRRNEYVRIEIDKSLQRNIPKGPTKGQQREDALMNARFYLRDSKFELQEPLWKIGRSDNKHYFLVKSKTTKRPFVMTVALRGPLCMLPIQENVRIQQTVKDLLKTFNHPYILKTVEAEFLPGQKCGLITFRPWSRVGSLKDIIYQTTPNKPYDQKYESRAKGVPLGTNHVQQYGRQILEGIQHFQEIGLQYPDLHSGNVMLFDGICQLSDYDNILVGNLAHYLTFTNAQTPLRDFGCLLFEMSFGFEPSKRDIKHPPVGCPEEIKTILNMIFIQRPAATLDDLITHPFFNVIPRGLSATNEDHDLEVDISPEFAEIFAAIAEKKPLKPLKSSKGTRRKRKGTDSPKTTSTTQPLLDPASQPPTNNNPPPAPAPPTPRASAAADGPPADRSQLMKSIRQGKSLKHNADVNDRSAPQL